MLTNGEKDVEDNIEDKKTTSEDDFEVEVEENDEEDAPKKAESEDDSPESEEKDELSEHTDSVKRRINKLTYKVREAERRELEALEYAKAVKAELDQIKKRETSISRSFEAEAEARLKTQEELLRKELRVAVDTGDVDTQVEVQTKLARLVSDGERLANFKSYRKQQEDVSVYQPAYIPQPQAPRLDPKAQEWAERNKWFGSDRVMTQAALAIHEEIVSEGVNPVSDIYYRELDTRMKREFPHKFVQAKKPNSQVASGRPSQVKKASGSIELNESQKSIAKRLGISYDAYKRQLKLVQERID